MHGVRRKARSCALQMLYQKEINSDWDSSMVEMFWHFSSGSKKVRSFATELLEATTENREEIDSKLSEVLEDWKLNRLSVVIRNLLRMALCEMLYLKTASFQVVINEAVELAKDFMDEDSAKFVNSVLDKCILDKNGEKTDEQPL